VVVLAFPYADFTRQKKRPALVVGMAEFGNLILCQITSNRLTSKSAIKISTDDFTTGGLRIVSYARPDKLFTVQPSLIQGTPGKLSAEKLREVHHAIRSLFS
jgi:mRNA interferase MazF